MGAEGTNARRLTTRADTTRSRGGRPAGTRSLHSPRRRSHHLWAVGPDGSNARALTQGNGTTRRPRGRRTGATRVPILPRRRPDQLYTMLADGHRAAASHPRPGWRHKSNMVASPTMRPRRSPTSERSVGMIGKEATFSRCRAHSPRPWSCGLSGSRLLWRDRPRRGAGPVAARGSGAGGTGAGTGASGTGAGGAIGGGPGSAGSMAPWGRPAARAPERRRGRRRGRGCGRRAAAGAADPVPASPKEFVESPPPGRLLRVRSVRRPAGEQGPSTRTPGG